MAGDFTALEYHLGTQHPDGELLDHRRAYVPSMRPTLYKRYRGLPAVELDIGAPAGRPAALSAIGGFSAAVKAPDLDALARVLHYSAGITKRIRGYPFRAAACTGALYHIELYAVCRELAGLPAGVYHYDPEGSRLLRLREGDQRAVLAEAAGGSGAVHSSPVTLVYTDVYWRNAIKYQARAYRHAFWDAGTIVANTLSMATALELPATLLMGFVDQALARLLGIDLDEELPLALVTLGSGESAGPAAASQPPEIRPDWEPKSSGSRAFPAIPRAHRATSLGSPEQVRTWRRESASSNGERAGQSPAPEAEPAAELPSQSLERVIVGRGSSRAFARDPIQLEQLAALLDRSIRPIRTDYQPPTGLIRPYLIANAVEGLEPGVYQVLAKVQERRPGLRQVRPGNFRMHAAQLALGQALGGDAAANLYFMAPLEQVLARYGQRGYRLAQMEAAVMAGWGYLAAYALGIGATGLTFFDEMVEDFLGVSEEGLKVMFLLAVGVPASG